MKKTRTTLHRLVICATIDNVDPVIIMSDDGIKNSTQKPTEYVIKPVPLLQETIESFATAAVQNKRQQRGIESDIHKKYTRMQNNKYNVAFRNCKGRKR